MNIHEAQKIEPIELYPGFEAHLLHTERATYSYVRVTEGAILPEHSHSEEQVLHILEGRLLVTIDGEERECKAGQIVVIPSSAIHSVVGVTDCWVLDVFTPVRLAYRELGADGYVGSV